MGDSHVADISLGSLEKETFPGGGVKAKCDFVGGGGPKRGTGWHLPPPPDCVKKALDSVCAFINK